MKNNQRELAALELAEGEEPETSLIIDAKGRVQVCRFDSVKVGWWIFSAWVYRRVVIRRTTIGKVIHELTTQASPVIAKLIRSRIERRSTRRLKTKTKKKLNALVAGLCSSAFEQVSHALEVRVRELEQGALSARATRIVMACTDRVLANFKKEVERGIADIISGVLQRSYLRIQEAAIADYCRAGNESDMVAENDPWLVLPEGTKHISVKGESVVLVVEEKPQKRTLFFDNQHYYLALPYVVFVMHFVAKRLVKSSFYVYFRNKPIERTTAKLGCCGLPCVNNDGRLHFCNYADFPGKSTTIAEAANHAISQFWQSRFHLDELYSLGPILSNQKVSLHAWEGKSAEDPDFILKTSWSAAVVLRDKIDLVHESIRGQRRANVVITDIVVDSGQEVRVEIEEFLASLETKTRFSRVIVDELAGLIPRLDEAQVNIIRAALQLALTKKSAEMRPQILEEVMAEVLESVLPELVRPEDITTVTGSLDVRVLLEKGG